MNFVQLLRRALVLVGCLSSMLIFVIFNLQIKPMSYVFVDPELKQRENFRQYSGNLDAQNLTMKITHTAMQIAKRSNLVMLSILNDAYIPFTYSWLCNTKPMNIHHLVLFVVTDLKSFRLLKSDWPDVNTVYMPVMEVQGNQEYSKAGYVKMMHLRTQVIYQLLKQRIPIFLFETDSLWMENPIPDILQTASDHDMLLVRPSHNKGYLGGFLYLMPTNNTLQVWGELAFKMWDLYLKIKPYYGTRNISDNQNDQVFLSHIIQNTDLDLRVAQLSNEKIVDGKWYLTFTEEDRSRLRPHVINNNWMKGNKNKILRAKAWGHWFISDTYRCDMNNVMKTIRL